MRIPYGRNLLSQPYHLYNQIQNGSWKSQDYSRMGPFLLFERFQRFIDFVNFYCHFIKHFSKIARFLTKLMKKDIYWIWTLVIDIIFVKFKYIFISVSVLVYFDPFQKIILETDISNWTSGNVLSQYQSDNILQSMAYFSAKYSPTKYNYEIYNKEFLIIIKNLEE